MGTNMGTKGRAVPRIVCCAIPISQDGKVLVVTSRKRPDCWVLPKGGWEPTDVQLEDAASREAFEEAGVRGTITNYVKEIQSPAVTYHFFELDVITLEQDWLERAERQREWVDYAEAIRRLQWKRELAQGLESSTLNSCRRTKVFGAQRSDCCLEDSRRPQQAFVTNVIGSMAPLCGQRDSCTKSSTVVLSP